MGDILTNGINEILNARIEILKDRRNNTKSKLEKIYCKKVITNLIQMKMGLKLDV